MNTMISKEDYLKAISAWEKERSDFPTIKKLVNPTSIFRLHQDDLEWFKNNNRYYNFHAYLGIQQDKLVLIIVPLNAKGEELEAPYLTLPLQPLVKSLYLEEQWMISTVRKVTLSGNLQVLKNEEIKNLPYDNKPNINLHTAISYMQSWRNQCINWFYAKCNAPDKGASIVKLFKVPTPDLMKGEEVSEIYCFFGFRETEIYDGLVPILIFVGYDSVTQTASLLKSVLNKTNKESPQQGNRQSSIEEVDSNADDWSTPCPPFCGNI